MTSSIPFPMASDYLIGTGYTAPRYAVLTLKLDF